MATDNGGNRLRNVVIGLLAFVAIAGILFVIGRTFVFSTYFLPSDSMAPALESGDRIVVNRLDRSPERGEVVVHTREDGLDLVKRVIALGEETVEAVDGQLFINGELLIEPYLGSATVTEDFGPVTVPADSLFLMGDNRGNANDSRFTGPVLLEDVVGTVLGA